MTKKISTASKRYLQKRYRLMNVLYTSTGLSFNFLDAEVGDVLDLTMSRGYNERIILGSCFGRLWANHTINEFNENDFGGDGNFLGH